MGLAQAQFDLLAFQKKVELSFSTLPHSTTNNGLVLLFLFKKFHCTEKSIDSTP
jgi:hypothetical protein